MAAHLELCLLGTPLVTANDKPVFGFESRKALALLCYLAARARGPAGTDCVDRAQLATLFWYDKPEARGRGNLSRVLNNLSCRFPNSIAATRDSVGLVPGRFRLDIHSFQARSAEASPDSLAGAAALYRDEFLSGLSLDGCPEFETWLVAEREHWQQRIVAVLDRLCEYWTVNGEYARAMPFAARLLEVAPWREESHYRMMQLLARTGERSAALHQFETARRVLGQELGVEPSSATLALVQQIRADALAPTRPPPGRSACSTRQSSFDARKTRTKSGLALEDAETLLDSSLVRFQQSGDQYGLGFSLIVLALTIKQKGMISQARRYFAEGIEILRQRDDTSNLPLVLGQVGRMLL